MDVFPTILDILGMADETLDGKSLLPYLQHGKDPDPRNEFLLEFHGIRYLYTQRAIVTRDGWKYVFTPGDRDEVYNLIEDPGELHNCIENPAHRAKIAKLQDRLINSVIAAKDPIMDAVCKLLGRWENPSGQIDASVIKKGKK
jgi:arylsulfatase A-like enzyme